MLVGREDGYLTTTVTESTAVQSVQFLQTGTRLIFRPFIADDGYIRMEVHPEDSDGKVVSGLPSKTTTEVTTNILVKDGHTIVIGGLFRESSLIDRSQTPGLGNLPLIGALFRQQTDSTTREEIIIMLTPHIIKDDSAYSAVSEQALKDLDKLRVGTRRGMMPWGRERLAECCYDDAVKEMSKPLPDRKKALWCLDCATNLNPMFLEAVKMKETLTRHEVTSVDNSSVRYFVKRQILADRAAAAGSADSQTIRPIVVAALNKPEVVLVPKPAAATTRPSDPRADLAAPWSLKLSSVFDLSWARGKGPVPSAPATQIHPLDVADEGEAAVERTAAIQNVAPAMPPISAAPPSPTTRPARPDGGDGGVVVTELPADEAEGAGQPAQNGK